jgi:NAD(P)H-hydrate repair Nnr-like enzyme with NAD(P)H-hydrate dehydratase domain
VLSGPIGTIGLEKLGGGQMPTGGSGNVLSGPIGGVPGGSELSIPGPSTPGNELSGYPPLIPSTFK